MAGAVIASAPVMLVFCFFQKQLIAGVALSGIEG
jgi:ABC-type glycerol-3-phosphate transport system permease component